MKINGHEVKFGIQTPPEYVSFEELKNTWLEAEKLGFDSAWLYDHFFPIIGDPSGPCHEGWTALSALAALTSKIHCGIMVTGNTYRNPAVLAKMGATVDVLSNGRLSMGLGAAWFELEHNAYDIPFYTVGQRIRRCDEACEIIKRLWSEEKVNFDGKYYKIKDAYCNPKPAQKPRPPLMIGGQGEKLMLRVVAKHADAWNCFGSPEYLAHKITVMREHGNAVGRDTNEIEKSVICSPCVTEDKAKIKEAVALYAKFFRLESEDDARRRMLAGNASEVTKRVKEYLEVGVTHIILGMLPPYDMESVRNFSDMVMPQFR